MPLLIIRDDITRVRCDAIVNAANNTLLGGGGVDGAIHRAAGPQLRAECARLGGCLTGQAKITGGHRLPCKYIIHTVGPIWQGGARGEEQRLRSCYRQSLLLAQQHGCESVAFPLISAGAYGYPAQQALQVAAGEIRAFLTASGEHEMTVYLVVYNANAFEISKSLFDSVTAYLDENYIPEEDTRRRRGWQASSLASEIFSETACAEALPAPDAEDFAPCPLETPAAMPKECAAAPARKPRKHKAPPLMSGSIFADRATPAPTPLEELVSHLDESFSQMLLRKIDEKGMTDAQCYKKANIDRKLFSKIHSSPSYKPSKATALAFAIALELPLPEARQLLARAGFAFSPSSIFDVVVMFFIQNGIYDVDQINQALFRYDQPLLGPQ